RPAAGPPAQAGAAPTARKTPDAKAAAAASLPPAKGASREGRTAGAASQSARVAGRGASQGVAKERRVASRDFGVFAAEKEANAIRLRWDKGPALAPHELVTALAAWEEANNRALASEEIFSGVDDVQAVLPVQERQLYLVKTATSQEEWVYLAVNPAKAGSYPAKAAAAFLEADIFAAKLITDREARKLAAEKPAVK
ncbi:MAG: hypothetical protein HGA96_16445, partial [Desulfobulbaceae bacterium]|nr:hypothetical protein [Desulfobulbaceae bacterium]